MGFWGRSRVRNYLDKPETVTQIHKSDPTVVSSTIDPARQLDLLSDVAAT
jgi:hypothetical protein